MREHVLANECVYHIYNRSIAHFEIFTARDECSRMKDMFKYYKTGESIPYSLQGQLKKPGSKPEKMVELIAYCLMPTHVHLVMKQLADDGITKFIGRIQNGYAKFFNSKYNRHGPLWDGRFKRVLVQTDEQLLHLTRYVHLNPVTAYLVKKASDWEFSSFNEYIGAAPDNLCELRNLLDFKPDSYANFVDDRADYQKKLAIIKHLLIDDQEQKRKPRGLKLP